MRKGANWRVRHWTESNCSLKVIVASWVRDPRMPFCSHLGNQHLGNQHLDKSRVGTSAEAGRPQQTLCSPRCVRAHNAAEVRSATPIRWNTLLRWVLTV